MIVVRNTDYDRACLLAAALQHPLPPDVSAPEGWPPPVEIAADTPLDAAGTTVETFKVFRLTTGGVVRTSAGETHGEAGSCVLESQATGERLLVLPADLLAQFREL